MSRRYASESVKLECSVGLEYSAELDVDIQLV